MGHLEKVPIYDGEQNTGSMGLNQNAVTTFKLLCEQLSARAEETSHVCLCSDKTDLYGAWLVVQSDSGATTLLRGQEKPGNQSYKDDFQQGQLCLSKGSAARTKLNDWLGKVGGDQNHYLVYLMHSRRASIVLLGLFFALLFATQESSTDVLNLLVLL